jgi:hypothetical protein
MKRVFHYTAELYLERIFSSYALLPSNVGAESEGSAVWFSARETYEPTAVKMIQTPDGTVRSLSVAEQMTKVGGARFGLPADDERLLPWRKACAALGTPFKHRKAMEVVGRKQGANPDHWFAVLAPLSISELTLEVWRNGAWRPFDPNEKPAFQEMPKE